MLTGLATGFLIVVLAIAGDLSPIGFFCLLAIGGVLSAGMTSAFSSLLSTDESFEMRVRHSHLEGAHLAVPEAARLQEIERVIEEMEEHLEQARRLGRRLAEEVAGETSGGAKGEFAETGSEPAPLGQTGTGVLPDIGTVMEVIAKHRTAEILLALSEGQLRFMELSRALPGISDRHLSMRLRQLEEEGLVERETESSVPPRVTYFLTKRGAELVSAISQIKAWAQHGYRPSEERQQPSRTDTPS